MCGALIPLVLLPVVDSQHLDGEEVPPEVGERQRHHRPDQRDLTRPKPQRLSSSTRDAPYIRGASGQGEGDAPHVLRAFGLADEFQTVEIKTNGRAIVEVRRGGGWQPCTGYRLRRARTFPPVRPECIRRVRERVRLRVGGSKQSLVLFTLFISGRLFTPPGAKRILNHQLFKTCTLDFGLR